MSSEALKALMSKQSMSSTMVESARAIVSAANKNATVTIRKFDNAVKTQSAGQVKPVAK